MLFYFECFFKYQDDDFQAMASLSSSVAAQSSHCHSDGDRRHSLGLLVVDDWLQLDDDIHPSVHLLSADWFKSACRFVKFLSAYVDVVHDVNVSYGIVTERERERERDRHQIDYQMVKVVSHCNCILKVCFLSCSLISFLYIGDARIHSRICKSVHWKNTLFHLHQWNILL